MRQTIFNAIITVLNTLAFFKGEDGTIRVYDYPISAPPGYPYAVVGSESLESTVLDSARDSRLYDFVIQVVGEKFGDPAGKTQSQAMSAMRDVEDQLLALLDNNNLLAQPAIVIRTMPVAATYGFTDGNSRMIYTMKIRVETTANITMQ